jgi:glycosyltransferase involved in cell wall biosynthesis
VVLRSVRLNFLELEEMKPAVSVCICVRNVEKYIGNCIKSILNQNFSNFEIVIIDDSSADRTKEIIEKFDDKRIKYFRSNKQLGISKSRNLSVKYSKGDYLFFTDGDCIVSKNWIEQGLKFLKDPNCAGVEGKTYYVSKKYKPTFSDHTYGYNRGDFMSGNIAYKKSIIEKVGGFDERYSYLEDRDLALRILRTSMIRYNPDMVVYVQKEIVTPRKLISQSHILKNRVYLYKRFSEKKAMSWHFVDLISLAKIIFPPLVFMSLFFNTFKTSDDYRLLPFMYVKAILERLELWKTCAKERVFLI